MPHTQWLNQIQIFEYQQEEEYYQQLAREFLELAERAISNKGCFCAVLGGGNTPKYINAQIVELHSQYDIDWSRVHIVLSDERWVKEDDALSNYRMILETLVMPLNIKNFYNIYLDGKTVEEGARAYSVYLEQLFRELGQNAFDYAQLGVGNDGHTASLFPGRRHLAEGGQKAICGGIGPEGAERISLSYEVLSECKTTSFLVNSPGKIEILQLMKEKWEPDKYPIQNINAHKNMYVYGG